MAQVTDKPFATIESAQQFITLLFDTIHEAKCDVDADIMKQSQPSRRLDALRIATVHLQNLEHHIVRTRRILNDLRTLRRLLFDERSSAPIPVPGLVFHRLTPAPVTSPMPQNVMRAKAAAAD